MDYRSKENTMYVEPTRVTTSYFADIRDFPIITEEEEKRLILLAQNGDIGARDIVVQSQLRFVVSVVKHTGFQEHFNDLVSEGNIGVIEAIYNFDVTCGNRFSSYCVHWIRKKINEYLMMNTNTVRLKSSSKVRKLVKKYKKMFFDEFGYSPLDSELITYMRDKGEYISEKQPLYVSSTPIMASEDDPSDGLTNEVLSLTSSCNTEAYIQSVDNKESVNRFLSLCSDEERDIIKKLYGIGCERMTVKAISEITGINPYKVENAVRRVVKRVKKIEMQRRK